MKTLFFYTTICCLFSIAMAAQQTECSNTKLILKNKMPPQWISEYNTTGIIYAKKGRFKQAKAIFEAYEKRFPNNSMTHRNWTVYYALQDKKEQALMHLYRAVALGYTDVQWLKTDESMKNLRSEKAFWEILKDLEQKTQY